MRSPLSVSNNFSIKETFNYLKTYKKERGISINHPTLDLIEPNIQSYSGFNILAFIEAMFNVEITSYFSLVRHNYINALFNRDVMVKGSTIIYLLVFVVICVFINKFSRNDKKILISSLFSTFLIIFHIYIIYILYQTTFVEFEAIDLASFERYINTILVSSTYFLIMLFLSTNINKSYFILLAIFVILFDSVFIHKTYYQITPGFITHDKEIMSEDKMIARKIIEKTDENSKIFVISENDGGRAVTLLRFYANPREINGISSNIMNHISTMLSDNINTSDLLEEIKKYDYLYMVLEDGSFIKKHDSIFDNSDSFVNNSLYKISIVENNKIHLSIVQIIND